MTEKASGGTERTGVMTTDNKRVFIAPEMPMRQVIRISGSVRGMLANLGFDRTDDEECTLETFCRQRNLDTKTLLRVLEGLDAECPQDFERSPEVMTLTEHCDRLECRHARLAETFHQWLAGSSGTGAKRFASVVGQVLAHLQREREWLLPLIRELDGAGSVSAEMRKELAYRLQVMRDEHGVLEEALAALEEWEDNEVDSDQRSKTWLADFSGALHGQIHEEEQILYRRVAGWVRVPA